MSDTQIKVTVDIEGDEGTSHFWMFGTHLEMEDEGDALVMRLAKPRDMVTKTKVKEAK